MKIGILGSGPVGKSLGTGFIKHGFEVMGVAESARAIEPLCILWCIPGLRENRWTHAFKLLEK